MYIDDQGRRYPYIHYLAEPIKEYLAGWYFEDELGCFGNNFPYETIEEAVGALERHVKYLNDTHCDSFSGKTRYPT
jgi:hypothetical protein